MTKSPPWLEWLSLLGICLAPLACVPEDGSQGSTGGTTTSNEGTDTQSPTTDTGEDSESGTDATDAESSSESTGTDSETDAETETGSDAETETGSESESGSDTDTDSDTDSDSETDSDSDTDIGDDGPLELVAAQLSDDYETLVLSFSTNVSAVDAVDPADFRISYAWTYTVEHKVVYEMSYYRDPSVQLAGPPQQLTAIANGPKLYQLSLTLDPPLTAEICNLPENFLNGLDNGVDGESALFPHYSPGSAPVANGGGDELAAIGSQWVLTDKDWLLYEEFGWPYLAPQIPIACP